MKKILLIQVLLIVTSIFAVTEWASQFPFPSPLVKPFLPPHQRWPTEQVKAWIESGNYDKSFLAYFARDPNRTIPPGNNAVSPADGVIKDIVRQDGTTYFVVGLSFWDVHVVRTPVAGIIRRVESKGLTFFRDSSETADQVYLRGKAGPVQQVLTLDTAFGEVKLRLITSYWASRLKVWVHQGDHLQKGQRVGRILLGSSVVVDFPRNVTFSVRKGQRVVAGETIIAKGPG
jgi:phosphatidylserine decarboxylase